MKIYYMIMPVSEITAEISSAVMASSGNDISAARKNDDGSKCVFKVYMPIPSILAVYQCFTKERIVEVMLEDEWNSDPVEPMGLFGTFTNLFSPK